MFIETPRFPEAVSLGFSGGPGFSTDVVGVNSGREYRNQNWSMARRKYEASHAARLPKHYRPLQAMFHIAAGRANGFRLKDWLDYRDDDAGGTGVLAVIDSNDMTYQLYKRYTFGSNTHNRIIQKPVSGTIVITGGTVDSIDYTTGIVTMTGGIPTSWTGEFDVPCRFDTDEMKADAIDKQGEDLIVGWSDIPIIEILL